MQKKQLIIINISALAMCLPLHADFSSRELLKRTPSARRQDNALPTKGRPVGDDVKFNLTLSDECAPIPVAAPGNLSTVASSKTGVYCLTQDLNGSVVIDFSNVILDLNGHKITASDGAPAVAVTSGQHNVTVRNGSVEAGSNSGQAAGIDMSNGGICFSVNNVTVGGWYIGIGARDVVNLTVHDVCAVGNSFAGIIGVNANNCDIRRSAFADNALFGLALSGSEGNGKGGYVHDCHFTQSSGEALLVDRFHNVEIVNCTVSAPSSVAASAAFHFNDSHNVKASNCSAYSLSSGDSYLSAAGFLVTNSDATLVGCVAKKNDSGFVIKTSGTGIVQECSAVANTVCGFDNDSENVSYVYVANTSKENGSAPAGSADTNYCNAGTGSAFPTSVAPYYQTVQTSAGGYWSNLTF